MAALEILSALFKIECLLGIVVGTVHVIRVRERT